MNRNLLLGFFLFTCAFARAQVNLVLNPDFEENWRCPYEYDQIKFAKYWSPIDTVSASQVDSFGNPNCTPEYCNACADYATHAHVSIPYNNKFYQYPRSGNGLAQVMMYFDESVSPMPYQRDYLQGHLSQTLISGKSYCITFYAVLGEAWGYGVDHIGAFLDNGGIDTTIVSCGLPLTAYTPQVFSQTVITDTQNWVRIEGNFIANGTERFITIGNFADKLHTNAVYVFNTINAATHSPFGVYLIDDVSLIESDLPAYAGDDRAIVAGDSTFIGRPPEVGLECVWHTLAGDSIGTGGGIWVKPAQTTTYVVTQTLCGVAKNDTVTVYVWPTGLSRLAMNSAQVTLSPNPAHTEITINAGIANDEMVSVSMYDVSGRQVMNQSAHFTNNSVRLPLNLEAGVYMLQLKDACGGRCIKRLVVQ